MRCILEPLRDLEAPAALSDQANETSLGAKLSDLGNRANTEAVLATADLRPRSINTTPNREFSFFNSSASMIK
jgi:hypothetical protein